jgi:hypothetical protein
MQSMYPPDLIESLLARGYQPGPAAQVAPDVQEIDRDCCREMECPQCRRRGLGYHPFHKGTSYRVVGLCHECGTEEEL